MLTLDNGTVPFLNFILCIWVKIFLSMADDIDDLLDEVEFKFCNDSPTNGGKNSTKNRYLRQWQFFVLLLPSVQSVSYKHCL